MSLNEKVKAFARAYPDVGDLLSGQNPGVVYPLYRHYRYLPPRVIDDPLTRPETPSQTVTVTNPPTESPTKAPTASANEPPTKVVSEQHSGTPTAELSGSLTTIPRNEPTVAPNASPSETTVDGPAAAPNASPSETTVDGPAAAPNASPSETTVDGPAAAPNASPSETTVDGPAAAPNASPSETTVDGPAAAPNASPSETNVDGPAAAPNASPSETTVDGPAAAPNASPSETTFDCVSDAEGRFMTTNDFTGVSYLNYKYSLLSNPDLGDVETEVLPVVEKAILDSILPDIFGDFCSNRRVLKQTKLRNRSRRLAIVGASSLPPDEISNDDCVSENPILNCNIIEGRMSIYSDGDPTENYDHITNLACTAMEGLKDDTFLSHPALVSATCIKDNLGSIGTGGDNDFDGTGSENTQRASGDLNATYLAAALSAFTVVFGVYAYRRRVKKRDVDQNIESLDDSDMNDISTSTHAVCVDGDEAPLNTWSGKAKTTTPAFDLNSIIPPRGYKPETVEESAEEYMDEELDEVSLSQLNMLSGDDSNLS